MIKINICRFGGRGASSSNSSLRSKVDNIINTGEVIEFSIGPQMTIMSLYENGRYETRYATIDEPMKNADKVLDYVKNEAVVLIDKDQEKYRSNFFKRKGFEIVGISPKYYKHDNTPSAYEEYLLIRRKEQ